MEARGSCKFEGNLKDSWISMAKQKLNRVTEKAACLIFQWKTANMMRNRNMTELTGAVVVPAPC